MPDVTVRSTISHTHLQSVIRSDVTSSGQLIANQVFQFFLDSKAEKLCTNGSIPANQSWPYLIEAGFARGLQERLW